ncbi:recombinase family protein [Pseudobacteroides cellulosolvens]|uniref:Resolvase domain-containing protein n=1 Tax=Pseudobacteroides cellulosolvens ATCC 35603 = DSM 2933 TaxID=398512 RepID=A0A0L6JUI5_9FIRM|nr:recombinase family protein [Pseudobacteroides cellulosolvens]KNY29483.1 Resolvase domain-containing protein [Pseudobacteroides cellulosolvens ATCC 35603 = DSM 2933]
MAEVKVIQANPNRINRNTSKIIERIRVAAYCRVSTDSEEQLTSYNSQVMHYKSMVESEPEWELVDIYADEGISGTQTDKRVEFQRMINDAVAGRIDLIITKSISRFARNTLDTLKYVRLLKDYNVAILFEKENINTLTMNGEMLLVILSSLAQQESESISANVKMGLKMKMKRGELVGFHGCLGYDYNPIDKTLSVNEEEAEIVRYIFRRYVEGAGAFVIAKELTKLNYKTKKGNTKWNESAVRGIIKNEKYKGDILLGKTFTVDPLTHRRLENMGEEEKYYISKNHEPIISEELFEEAQKILQVRSSKHNNKGRTDKFSKKYSFSSIIKCGFCGKTAVRRTWHSKSIHEKHVWSCMTSVKEGKKYCPDSKGIDEKEIEKAFIDSFNMLCSKNRNVIEEFLVEMEESLSNLDIAKELKRVQREIDSIENKLSKIVDMRVDEVIDKDTYEAKYIELSGKLEKLKSERVDLQVSVDEKTDLKKRMKAFRELYEKNEQLTEFDRHVFESVVEEVILGKVDEKGNKKPYFITFVFKTGFKIEADGQKKKENSKGKKSGVPSETNSENMCSYSADDTRGVRGIDNKGLEWGVWKGLI